MDIRKSSKALLQGLSKVLLDSSRTLQKSYGNSVNEPNESIAVDDGDVII